MSDDDDDGDGGAAEERRADDADRRAAGDNSDQRIVMDRRTMKGRPSRRWLINTLLNCCYGRCSIEAGRGKQSALIKKQHVLRSKQQLLNATC